MVGACVIDADARFVRPVRTPAGRLRLPRQGGDELILGVEQFCSWMMGSRSKMVRLVWPVRRMATRSGTLARIRVRAAAPAIVEAAGRHAALLHEYPLRVGRGVGARIPRPR